MVGSSSTILSNSAFASLNLFPATPTHIPSRYTPSLTPTPSSRPSIRDRASSRSSKPPPIIPIRHSSIISDWTSPSTPDLSYYLEPSPSSLPSPAFSVESNQPLTPTTPTCTSKPDSPSSARSRRSFRSSIMALRSFSVVDLGSPVVISGEHDAEAKPGSVHVGKERLVNWARPFQGSTTEINIQIFGQSAQRARRMKKSPTTDSFDLAYPSPTPSSSDDEPLPTTPAGNDVVPSRSWLASSGLTGLGVKGIKDFDAYEGDNLDSTLPSITEDLLQQLHLGDAIGASSSSSNQSSSSATPIELNSPVFESAFPPPTIAYRRQGVTPTRLLTSSQSLGSLASPSNLAELRQLQQAAVDMEYEARRPFKLNLPQEREKRIRRKAVPVVVAADISSQQPVASSSRLFTLEVASVEISRSNSGSSSSSGNRADESGSEAATVSASPRVMIVSEPVTPLRSPSTPSTARETPMRRFYGNAKATMSMIDVSPRLASLPIFVPPRSASKSPAHQRSASDSPASSVSSARKNSSDASSDSGESWDQPVTPSSFNSARIGGNSFQFGPSPPIKSKKAGGIYGNKSAFLSQLDLGLKRVMDRKGETDEEGKKHKRGLSRFLGMKA